MDPSGEIVWTILSRLTKNRFGQRFDPIFLTTTTAAAILHWTRTHQIRERCSHLKRARLLKSPKWVGFIIAMSEEQPDCALPITWQAIPP